MRNRINRRNVIAGLAVAPLAGVAASLPAMATSDVHAAAARHKAAWQTFEDNVWRADDMDPRYTSDTSENNAAIYDATDEAEEQAFRQFMEVRPQAPVDMKAKAEYLLDHLRGGYVSDENWEVFLKAMI